MSDMKEQAGFKFKTNADGRMMIFDEIRNKFLVNTPEEWVRQNTVKFIHEELGFPKSLIALEKAFKLHRRTKRTDIVVHDNDGKALILVECKRPSIKITQSTFDQAFRYNIILKVPYLVITNGEELYCCLVEGEQVTFIEKFPTYQEFKND
ncbi:MAG: type I site-specific restriction endonuclease [Salibacteraceae bacterium]|jgi:type I site-specific restriction endonuclease